MVTKLENIQAKIAKLQQQADAIKAERTQAVVRQIHDLMLEYGLTMKDIGAASNRKGRRLNGHGAGSKGKLPPKYMNPKTGETWSGHARPPAWIKDVKDRSKFLINGNAAHASAQKGASAKPAAKRTVPPKYRNPQTGATWTGRGLPPAWIASAKDRNKFLIDAPVTDTKPARGKRAPAKGVAARKTNGARKATTAKTASKKSSGRTALKSKRAVSKNSTESTPAATGEQSTQALAQAA
ncbi:H-NS family nucleoid-associated regulatory protein [Burkholderia ambifaria]|uniref:H-NS family nucleoid-associated regulatory protein n=1 Tax=Burkholderia ambifaria TaxID=152480 RepID=UPI000F8053EA|nr:H-NS family nucleoid-associated regulatory protein [Burkholderia ambifaria]